jgi:hypothetical protein
MLMLIEWFGHSPDVAPNRKNFWITPTELQGVSPTQSLYSNVTFLFIRF